MPSCFVIQPFDGGRFDKRYTDVFKPAIEAAGLDLYRVDRDPSVSIPVNNIEQGIRGAAVYLADITLDNPNVWFELGYALATEKGDLHDLLRRSGRRNSPLTFSTATSFSTAWTLRATIARSKPSHRAPESPAREGPEARRL